MNCKLLSPKIAIGKMLEKIASIPYITRQVWMEEPNIPKWKYKYSPYYGYSGLLLWNYEETDKSLRQRLKNLR